MNQVTNNVLKKISRFIDLEKCPGAGYFKNCPETDFVLKVILANVLQLWDPHRWIRHPKLPLFRPQKHQNPSTGSKVRSILTILQIKVYY